MENKPVFHCNIFDHLLRQRLSQIGDVPRLEIVGRIIICKMQLKKCFIVSHPRKSKQTLVEEVSSFSSKFSSYHLEKDPVSGISRCIVLNVNLKSVAESVSIILAFRNRKPSKRSCICLAWRIFPLNCSSTTTAQAQFSVASIFLSFVFC